MIKGYVTAGGPFVPVRVDFERVSTREPRHDIQFLLDTGSAISVVNQIDAQAIGLDFDTDFVGAAFEINTGVGGHARHYRAPSWLEFMQADGAVSRYRFGLRIAEPTPASLTLPSILGMDFIQHFRLTVSVREERVEVEPLFDDA